MLDTTRELERQGFEVTYLDVKDNGLIDMDVLKQAIRPDTILVSVMLVNNEIGVIQDVEQIGAICREKGIIFHCDAAQATGKVVIDLNTLKCDLMSFSAHKTYGPKGIGALYVRRKPRVRIEAQMHGGGHERGMRSGTLATHQIVGMGEASASPARKCDRERAHPHAARPPVEWPEEHGRGLPERRPRAARAAQPERQLQLRRRRVADHGDQGCGRVVGLGLHLGLAGASYVLRALGRNDELAHSSIRFTVGRFTTEQEVDYTVELLKNKIGKLRDLSPLWEMFKDGVDLNSIQWAAH